MKFFIAMLFFVPIFYFFAYASSVTVITYTIDTTNCIKCGICEARADHSIDMDNDGYPYWINGLNIYHIRFLSDPLPIYVDDLDLTVSDCPTASITKGTFEKQKRPDSLSN